MARAAEVMIREATLIIRAWHAASSGTLRRNVLII